MAKKSSEDYSEAQLRGFHGHLKAAKTKDEREAIYKEIGAGGQALGQWFRRFGLEPLGPVGGDAAKKKPGRPAKGKAKGKTAVKRGRPATTAKNSPTVPSRSVKGTGLSREAREILIRLMDKLLAD